MQAIPSISVAPQPAPAPTESPAEGNNVGNDHFSRHLSDARRQVDRHEHDAKTAANDAKDRKPQTATEEKHTKGSKPTEKMETTASKHTDRADTGKDEKKANDTVAVNDRDLLQQILQSSMLSSTLNESGKSTGKITGNAEIVPADNDTLVIRQTKSILSLQDMSTQQTQGRKTILATVLDKVTGEQAPATIAQAPATIAQDQSMEEPVQQPGAQPEKMVVERWQTQFRYADTTAASSQEKTPIDQVKTEIPGMTLSSQTIQATITPDATPTAARAHGTAGNGVEVPQPPQDANSNFIHSNLPGVTTTDAEANASNEQQSGQADQNMAGNTTLANGSQAPAPPTGQETPLIFSLDQTGTASTPLSGLETSGSTSQHLPSGIDVPHSQIIDQVAGHLTMNRKLESGTIALRLHPAELGELRMEIKVEQDNIKAHITTQNPQVQDLLDRNLPRLRQALEQQGMNLAHMQVSLTTDDGGNGQFFQEQFNRQQFNHSSRTNSSRGNFSLPEEDMDEPYAADPNQNLSVHI